jgi:ferrous iron transport protein A
MIALKTTTLDQLPVSESARVCGLNGAPAVQQRLSEMGLTQGELVRVVRKAPLGDPVQIEVRGYQLSLRRSEVRSILVDRVPEKPIASAGDSVTVVAEGEPSGRMARWVRRFGWAGFLFFAIKGLLWLAIPTVLAVVASCRD